MEREAEAAYHGKQDGWEGNVRMGYQESLEKLTEAATGPILESDWMHMTCPVEKRWDELALDSEL